MMRGYINKKGYQSFNCILRMISQWAKNTLNLVLTLTDSKDRYRFALSSLCQKTQ